MQAPSILLRFLFLFTILAVAFGTPAPSKTTTVTVTATPTPSQCNVADQQCCNSVQDSSSSIVALLLELLGIAVGSVTGQVGVTCSPLTVIGLSGDSCNASPVCCSNNSFNGVIAIGCTPININL